MLILWVLISSLVAAEKVERHDIDGLLLARILSRENEQLSVDQKLRLSAQVATKYSYPPSFIKAFIAVFYSSPVDYTQAVTQLVNEAVAGASLGCGLCFSILGIIEEFQIGLISISQLHELMSVIPLRVQASYESISDALVATGLTYSSSLGLLAVVTSNMGLPESRERICTLFDRTIVDWAEEAASVDVGHTLLAPSVIDFDGTAPLNHLSVDMLDMQTGGLSYFIRIMKENADSLSSALWFGTEDVFGALGIDSTVSEDEVRRSIEELHGVDESVIAEDIIASIKTARYNVNAMRYNEGLEKVEAGDASECSRGIEDLVTIIRTQSLLVKALFYLMKISFFEFGNPQASRFAAMLLSSGGVLSGHLNGIKLEEHISKGAARIERASTEPFMRAVATSMECSGDLIARIHRTASVDCLNICVATSSCTNVVYQPITGLCRLYSSCDRYRSIDFRVAFYAKKAYQRGYINQASVVHLHSRAASLNNHADSMNWLVYHSKGIESMNEAIYWARQSASINNSEGIYLLAWLSGEDWPGHKGNSTEAYAHFSRLYYEIPEIPRRPAFPEDDPFILTEYKVIEGLATQLGITDLEMGLIFETPSLWPNRIAAYLGIMKLGLHKYAFWLPRIIGVLAFIPPLLVLVSHRNF